MSSIPPLAWYVQVESLHAMNIVGLEDER